MDWHVFNESEYALVQKTSTFKTAELICKNYGHGGHLVDIRSVDEQKFIEHLISNISQVNRSSDDSDQFWIGSRKSPYNSNLYIWIVNEHVIFDIDIIYSNWYPKEPDLSTTDDLCVYLSIEPCKYQRYKPICADFFGKWRSCDCQKLKQSICKRLVSNHFENSSLISTSLFIAMVLVNMSIYIKFF